MKTPALMLLAGLALIKISFAVDPPPDGGYPNQNTAEGEDALFSLSGSSGSNTALGFEALYATTTGYDNVAVGSAAMQKNTEGYANIAIGVQTLLANTTGWANVAVGTGAALENTNGWDNVAIGWNALYFNTYGQRNVAVGGYAGSGILGGLGNIAIGDGALGGDASFANYNTAVGYAALYNCKGYGNIGIGIIAGEKLNRGSHNIDIGNQGVVGENRTIRIGNPKTHQRAFITGIYTSAISDGVPVMVNADGQLGVATSSAGYKEDIRPMAKSSEAILSLQPVTFRYKEELDLDAIPQFGLVAEDVAKVDPDLVAKDDQGKPYTVRYDAVNAMLLNEFLKEHKKVEELGTEVAELKAAVQELRGAQTHNQ